jgi:DNA-binding response OmpR family regulator
MPILIVEDDDNTRECLAIYFKMINKPVITTSSIAGALKILEEIKPKTILLDLILDDGIAIPLIKIAKSFEDNPPKLILMSANHQAEQIANEYKIEHRLRKPFTLEALEELVK